MPSKYLHYFNNDRESSLLNDLVSESVKLTGFEVLYIPKEYIEDRIFSETMTSDFNGAYKVDMNIGETAYWEGDYSDFMNKFGLSSNNRATLKVSIQTFKRLNIPNRETPRAGDLIYLPFAQTYLEILFDIDELPLYAWGTTTTYTIFTEKFKHNYDNFDTGVEEIDRIEDIFSNENIVEAAQNEPIRIEALNVREDNNLGNIFRNL